MLLRVIETTDKQHMGLTFEVDPENIPTEYTLPGGDLIKIDRVERFDGGLKRVSSPNYVAWLIEVPE